MVDYFYSLWGKFGQRENLDTTEYVTNVKRFIELLVSQTTDMTDVHAVNAETLMVTYRTKSEFVEPSGRTNIFIASFTTGLARLKLLMLLERLGENALYMETDSVIFKRKRDVDPLQDLLGENLGQLTNEIGGGNHIVEFVSEPKNYGYLLSNGKQEFKVCRIT